MNIFLDEIINYFPWRPMGTISNPILILEPNTTVLKEFSNSSVIESLRKKVQSAEKVDTHFSELEIKEYIYQNIRDMFIVDESDIEFVLNKETESYLNELRKAEERFSK